MQFRARIIEIEQGQNEIVLHEKDAAELTLDVGDRVRVRADGKEITALVDHSASSVGRGEAVLFLEAARNLKAYPGQVLDVLPTQAPPSIDAIRKKMDGYAITKHETFGIIDDLMHEKLSAAELSAFITAIHMHGMSPHETASLTQAIYSSGDVLSWKQKHVVSLHSIGGVAGDRTTMVVVPILASLGLTVPKTATKAISSASGTVDAMNVLAPTALAFSEIQRVVNKTNGCIAWGGAVNLAMADDRLIKIRNPLRLDPEGLVLSSILAKKKAEGAKYVLLDVPFGRGAKVSELSRAKTLASSFHVLSKHLGLNLDAVITDGSQPMLSTLGPALEARAVLDVLSGKANGQLLEKSCLFSALLLKMTKGVPQQRGYQLALQEVKSGRALKKFRQIIEAQGGDPNVGPEGVEVGAERVAVVAEESGVVGHVDNRNASRVARALGAPTNARAGLVLHARRGDAVKKGQKLLELVTTDKRKLKFGLEELNAHGVFEFDKIIVEHVNG